MHMTGTERLISSLSGEAVDRPPIWLREGFNLYENIPDETDFHQGWKAQPIYCNLIKDLTPYCDVIRDWGGHAFNRFLMIPPKYMETNEYMISENLKRFEGKIHTPNRTLTFARDSKHGQYTSWVTKELVESIDDLYALMDIPFEIDREKVQQDVEKHSEIRKQVGTLGITRLFISSPIVIISGCMSFESFLEMTITENELFHEILKEVTRRNLLLLDEYFRKQDVDSIITLGGSEQCTPPMMSPRYFDEFVVPYDTLIVKRLNEYNKLVTCHCHGKVKHALPLMIDIGYDGTDPVEPTPQGDVTYEEARKIASGKLTLIGNLEWSELEHSNPADIKKRVKDILAFGNDRLILAASAGPISEITSKLADNYRAWIEAALE